MKRKPSTTAMMERTYLTESRRNTYVALEELDMLWDQKDVLEFDKLWKQGWSLEHIAEELNRNINDCFALAFDRGMRGRIKPRKRGIWVN